MGPRVLLTGERRLDKKGAVDYAQAWVFDQDGALRKGAVLRGLGAVLEVSEHPQRDTSTDDHVTQTTHNADTSLEHKRPCMDP